MSAGELDLRGEDFPKKERPEFQQKSIGASKMCPCFKIHAGFNRDGGNPKILQGDMCDTCVTCVCHSGTDPYGRLARPAKTMVSRDSKYLKEHVLVWVNHGEHVFFLLHCPQRSGSNVQGLLGVDELRVAWTKRSGLQVFSDFCVRRGG